MPNTQNWWENLPKSGQLGKPKGLGGFYGQNIGEFSNELGLSGDYAGQIKKALDEAFANQMQTATQSATESAFAGGDFNPELSKYYATKGAREAQTTGKIQGLQAGRQDELSRAGLMNQVFQNKLGQDSLNFQKDMYNDSQDFDIGDVLGFASSFVPFLEEGGDVMGSDYFNYAYGGGIPPVEINTNPAPTGDNTLIWAKDGEVIQSNPAGDLVGRENLKLINEAGKMVNNTLFGDTANMLSGMTKQNKGQQLGNNIAPLAGKFKDFVGGLFGGGGASAIQAKPMAGGGMAGNPEEELKQAEQLVKDMGYQLQGLSQDHPDYQRKVQEYQGAVANYKGLLAQYNQTQPNQTQNPNVTVNPDEQKPQPQQPPKQKIIIERIGE